MLLNERGMIQVCNKDIEFPYRIVFIRVVYHPTLFQDFWSSSLRVFDTLHDSHKRYVAAGIHFTVRYTSIKYWLF